MFNNKIDDPSSYIEEFVSYSKYSRLTESSVANNVRHLMELKSFISQEYEMSINIGQLERSQLENFLAFLDKTRGLKPSTINRYIAILKSYYNFLAFETGGLHNPAAYIRYKEVPATLPPPTLSEEEVEQVLASAEGYNYYFYTLIKFLYCTGRRISPTLNVRKENVNLENNTVFFTSNNGEVESYLTINEDLASTLKRFLENHPVPESPYLFSSPYKPSKHITPDTVRLHFKRIGCIAGVNTSITPMILRRSMIIRTFKNLEKRFEPKLDYASYLKLNNLEDYLQYYLQQITSGS